MYLLLGYWNYTAIGKEDTKETLFILLVEIFQASVISCKRCPALLTFTVSFRHIRAGSWLCK